MGLRAGLLRESVTVKRPVVTRNDYNDEVVTYETAFTARARVVFRSGNRAVINHEEQNPYSVEFIIRSFYAVDNMMILEWRGNRYRILSNNFEPYKQQRTIIAELINE